MIFDAFNFAIKAHHPEIVDAPFAQADGHIHFITRLYAKDAVEALTKFKQQHPNALIDQVIRLK